MNKDDLLGEILDDERKQRDAAFDMMEYTRMKVTTPKHKFDEYDRRRLNDVTTAILQTAYVSNSELLRELNKALPWTEHKCPIEQSLRNALSVILDEDYQDECNGECPVHC